MILLTGSDEANSLRESRQGSMYAIVLVDFGGIGYWLVGGQGDER